MDRGAWWATVRGVTESDMAEGLTLSLWASLVAQMVKNLPANAGNTRDAGSVPGLGRSPGEENGYPLQYSCLENSMGREPGRLHSPWSHKESDMTERLTLSLLHLQGRCIKVPNAPGALIQRTLAFLQKPPRSKTNGRSKREERFSP